MLLSDPCNAHAEASIEYRLLIELWCKIEYTTSDTLYKFVKVKLR